MSHSNNLAHIRARFFNTVEGAGSDQYLEMYITPEILDDEEKIKQFFDDMAVSTIRFLKTGEKT